MLEEAPRVNDIERITREIVGEQIHLLCFEVRLVERCDEPWVQIDRQHGAGWRDVTGKPSRDRAAASADIEHSHSLGNPDLFEDPDRKRVPISLVRR
jgi:hypothetical protein